MPSKIDRFALLIFGRIPAVLGALFLTGFAAIVHQATYEAIGHDASLSERISDADYAAIVQRDYHDWVVSEIWLWLIVTLIDVLLFWLAFKKYSPVPRAARRSSPKITRDS